MRESYQKRIGIFSVRYNASNSAPDERRYIYGASLLIHERDGSREDQYHVSLDELHDLRYLCDQLLQHAEAK